MPYLAYIVRPADGLTGFEEELSRLGLNGNREKWVKCERLKIWVNRNRYSRYVPEWLLATWNMRVYERDVSTAL